MKSKIITKSHFIFLNRLRYYSFRDTDLGIEIALEPCLNGFDIAIYKSPGEMPGGSLLRSKVCTNDDGYGSTEFITTELLGEEPQDRRKETWDKALKVANMFYQSWTAHKKLQKAGLTKIDKYKFDDQFAEVDKRSKSIIIINTLISS